MKSSIKVLKKIPLLSSLNEKELALISRHLKSRRIKKGAALIMEKQKGSTFYMVSSGKVKIFQTGSAGKRKTLAVLGEGDFFGEMALLNKRERSASVDVLEDGEIYTLKRSDFEKIIMNNNKILIKVTRVLADRLRQADKEIKALTFQNILERLVWKLLELSRLRHTKEIQLSLKELEETIGSAREVISRALANLIKLKLIEKDRSKIYLTDIQGLKEFVNV